MWYIGFPQFEQFKFLPYYLSGIGHHDLQPPIYRPDGLNRHQLLYCENGSGILKIDNKTIIIESGYGFYIPPNLPHEYYPLEDIWDIRWISFDGFDAEHLCHLMKLQATKSYPLDSVTPLDALLNHMYHEGSSNPTAGYYIACSYVNTFIIEFSRQAHLIANNPKTATTYQQHFEILKDYIEQNYMRDIPLDELCNLLSVTPQHLCRIFQKCALSRPTKYINQIRLKHAKELLTTSCYPIAQIAMWCGYEHITYFNKLFKAETGITPGLYRLSYRKFN